MSNIDAKIAESFNFLIEIEKLKTIYRKAKIKADNNRYENSAEHSWHVAIASQVLQDYFEKPVDINKVIQILLIHDIVEIYAGDTPAFAENSSAQLQYQKELDAIEDIANRFKLTEVQKFKQLWLEYEESKTPEAQYSQCIDRILPILQNMQNNGGSWREFNVSKTKLQKRNHLLEKLSPQLWDYVNKQFDIAVANNWISAE